MTEFANGFTPPDRPSRSADAVGPGSGYRVTNARIYNLRYAFDGAAQDLSAYDWPSDVFAEYCEDYSYRDDEEQEDEDESDSPD